MARRPKVNMENYYAHKETIFQTVWLLTLAHQLEGLSGQRQGRNKFKDLGRFQKQAVGRNRSSGPWRGSQEATGHFM
ncbi:hypothetical protein M8C21_032832 [Ambrosia artemisiifolia]|uniref:Uncharacterized protein n=1 Tax=Ambrosia artemisiifolia TaxID=4212 RepID=A0AAD5DAP5_AMBAR|nr:hypothetical protein M8C21_032832 [Ambrosia artemisiifolia]